MIKINAFYNVDNMVLLTKMPDECIDLIYIDPPFSTGKVFKDKAGEIAFDDTKNLEGLVKYLIPRIHEMKRILKPTGLFYLHGDSRFLPYVRVEADKIFGIDNFRNEIIWYYNSGARKKKDFGRRHDSILRYSKTEDYYFNDEEVREPYSPSAPRGYEKEKYYNDLGKVMDDVWKINILGQNDKTERCGYPTQKPEALLERIIASSCPPNGVVADFFSGSGTTGIVAEKLGRRYLLCDDSISAMKAFNYRLERGK